MNKIKKTKKKHNKNIIELLLLPNQLFDINIIINKILTHMDNKNIYINITLLEHPIFFGFRKRVKNLKFNKLKLVYHHATCLNYINEIKNNKYINLINFIQYHETKKYSKPLNYYLNYLCKKNNSILVYFDPVDHELYNEISTFQNNNTLNNIIYLDNLLFLLSNKNLIEYNNIRKNKSFNHANFYSWHKKKINILVNNKSYDTQNRNKLPIDITIPELPDTHNLKNKYNKCIYKSIIYINKYFPNNYGKCSKINDLVFPISRIASLYWVKDFCYNKLHNFGKYQDSIDSLRRNYLYHSCISPMLNIGLITPNDVINIVSKYYNKHKNKINISNYEGFIRQIIGWREYQRYCYIYTYDKMISNNYFNNSKKLKQNWYDGNTNLKPVDDAIYMAWNDGYLHHILRLMVIGNMMNLCFIHPDEVYRWFMEFSIDSYDWVMIQNVYSMTLWSDGGLTMRKPYISSDNYIMKMSNYSKEKDIINKDGNIKKAGWNTMWYVLYYNFINKNRNKLKNTYYAGMIKNYDNKSDNEKKIISRLSNKFISTITY